MSELHAQFVFSVTCSNCGLVHGHRNAEQTTQHLHPMEYIKERQNEGWLITTLPAPKPYILCPACAKAAP